jgi:hypothetical protein
MATAQNINNRPSARILRVIPTAIAHDHARAFVAMFHPGVEWSDEECAELARTYNVTGQVPVWMRGTING